MSEGFSLIAKFRIITAQHQGERQKKKAKQFSRKFGKENKAKREWVVSRIDSKRAMTGRGSRKKRGVGGGFVSF